MSAICAVADLHGTPFDASPLRALFHAAPHRGGHQAILRPTAAVWLGAQHAAPACARASVAQLGPLSIAFHGRLDNLTELRAVLASRSPECADASAARTVLHAFRQWREACVARLVGDFAFIVHDSAARRLFCARDAVGVKPLYYHAGPSRIVAATEIGQVLASGVRLAPCEAMVAELLSFDVRTRAETLYQDVRRLPPGHWMAADEHGVQVVRYWTPDAIDELTYARDEDYAEHFSDLFGGAVAARAPADEHVAAYLSGGLDSSSVVCMAHALGRRLDTFSMLFPTVPEADERMYIDAVTSHVGLPSHRLEAAPIDSASYRRSAAARADLPDLPGDALGAPLLDAMQAGGFSAALTGAGGDYGFTGSFLHYAEFLQRRDVRGLLRQIRADRTTDDVGWSPSDVFTSGIRLLIPSALRRALRPVARRAGWGIAVPAWIAPAFAARTGLLDRLAAPRASGASGTPARQHVCALFESGWTTRLLESGDRMAAERGIELRHPFFDRRLVEFAIALPETQRWRRRTTKYVMRQAMRGRLPESVYARADKADASAFVPQVVECLGGDAALRDLHVEALGWVESGALLAEYDRARRQLAAGDSGYCEGMFTVWMALAVETWYRGMFVEGPTHDQVAHTAGRREAGGSHRRERRHAAEEALSDARAR